MKHVFVLFLCVGALTTFSYCAVPQPKPDNETNVDPPVISTTVTPKTSTTPSQNTTSSSTTSTTSTTTTTTTTTTTSTTTTTPKPPTPPTPLPPQPKPADPTKGTWMVVDATTNKTCVLVQMAAQLDVPYTVQNESRHGYIDIPANATATGDCNKESIELNWASVVVINGTNKTVSNVVGFGFIKVENGTKYGLVDMKAVVYPDEAAFPGFNNYSDPITFYHKNYSFVTSLKHSYKCDKQQTLNLTSNESSNDTVAYFHVSNVQFQAFANGTANNFLEAENCEAAETPDIVPIAVGCALVALIIIVLVAYLIGRRRSQARGYLSMFADTKRETDYIPMKNLNCFKN